MAGFALSAHYDSVPGSPNFAPTVEANYGEPGFEIGTKWNKTGI
jgi:hypothetical protein